MAKITPLGNLLSKFKKDEEEESITNQYDDGSVWTLPETSDASIGYQSPISNLIQNNKITVNSNMNQPDSLSKSQKHIRRNGNARER